MQEKLESYDDSIYKIFVALLIITALVILIILAVHEVDFDEDKTCSDCIEDGTCKDPETCETCDSEGCPECETCAESTTCDCEEEEKKQEEEEKKEDGDCSTISARKCRLEFTKDAKPLVVNRHTTSIKVPLSGFRTAFIGSHGSLCDWLDVTDRVKHMTDYKRGQTMTFTASQMQEFLDDSRRYFDVKGSGTTYSLPSTDADFVAPSCGSEEMILFTDDWLQRQLDLIDHDDFTAPAGTSGSTNSDTCYATAGDCKRALIGTPKRIINTTGTITLTLAAGEDIKYAYYGSSLQSCRWVDVTKQLKTEMGSDTSKSFNPDSLVYTTNDNTRYIADACANKFKNLIVFTTPFLDKMLDIYVQ